MKKNFEKQLQKLLKKYRINTSFQSTKNILIVANRDNLNANLRCSLIALNLRQKLLNNIYVLPEHALIIKDSKLLFNLLNLKIVNLKFLNFSIIKVIILFIVVNIKALFKKDRFEWIINNYSIENMKVGDLLYDDYIRKDKKFLNLNFYDLTFQKQLLLSILKVINLKKILVSKKISYCLVSTKGYLSNSAVITRVATKLKIKTLIASHHISIKFKDYNKTFSFFRKADPIEVIKETKNVKKKELESFLNKRFRGTYKGNYTAPWDLNHFKNSKKQINKIELLKLIPTKLKNPKIITFFCNAFSDGPHILGSERIFIDYYQAFIKTIEYASNYDNHNIWIFKPHPNSKKYNEQGIVENIVRKINKKNILLYPNFISQKSLLELSDILITDASTAGLEYAALGKKPIVTGDCPYFNKKFVFKPHDKENYFTLLKNIEKFDNKLNIINKNYAIKTLYYLEFLQTKLFLKNTELLNDNKYLHLNNREFINLLIKNKSYKKNLLNDNYIKLSSQAIYK